MNVEKLDMMIEDGIFEQAEIINHHIRQSEEAAKAIEGGDMVIEGKVVVITDKNGKPHYYTYDWNIASEYEFDTSLYPTSKKTAQEIAEEWSLNHGRISFEEFIDASNAEYKKIRKIYLEKGGSIVRDYDKKLSKEMKCSVSLLKEKFSEKAIENFKLILESKANLIKEAFGISTVEMKISDNYLKFEWFSEQTNVEEMQAYTEFLQKVGELARVQKRVTAKEKSVENKKYAFRCFLLRIGMIGEEYKGFRKILLKNLSGSSAFKSGNRNKKV